MRQETKETIWSQFGAAIDALENSIRACPESLWSDQNRFHQLWYMAYHTLFWLDYYLTENPAEYQPPEPFGLEELDPAGAMPERPYTQAELLAYLDHGRRKCRRVIREMTHEKAAGIFPMGRKELTHAELLLYNMRHVQHHTAQLNLLLRQEIDSAPRWSFQSKLGLDGSGDRPEARD